MMLDHALAILTGFLPLFLVFGPLAFLAWRRLRHRMAEVKRHEDAGTIGPTSALPGRALPWHYDKLAGIGSSGPAELSVNQRVLRPSIGVRLFVLGLVGAIVYFLARVPPELHGFEVAESGVAGWLMPALVLLAAANGVIYIFTYEARYDHQVLIVTRMIFLRREYLWKNLVRIADDGGYELHLTFQPGGKAKVLKHSTGIGAFKEFALAQIRKNRAAGP